VEDQIMRVLMLLAILFGGFGAPMARAQDAAADIQSVISNQIEAFRADDLEKAFSFASPMIQRMFGSPARFGQMVQEGYPMVRRPAEVKFSGLDELDGHKVQSVLMTDQDGTLFIVDYDMIQGEGGWQINGVRVRKAGDASA
jgi:Domain of unknown function (DUF4864)